MRKRTNAGRGGSTMKSKLMHNLGLKIMAVLISVVLWMLAVDINDPVINKYINNVQVQLTNTCLLYTSKTVRAPGGEQLADSDKKYSSAEAFKWAGTPK